MKELKSAIRYIKNAKELSQYTSLQKETEEKLDKAVSKIQEYMRKTSNTVSSPEDFEPMAHCVLPEF
jgi:hypothetical protein